MTAAKRKPNPFTTTITLLVHFFLLHCAAALNHSDTQALLLFKSSVDPSNTILTSWNYSSNVDPCTSWVGVSCLHNRVTRLVLENLNLNLNLNSSSSTINSLSSLTHIRVLSLKHNSLSGRFPNLSNLTNLRLLFVSHNHFSSHFPPSLSTLTKLYRLDLSHNSFTGIVPLSLNNLTHLLTLRIEENGFTGPISGLILPSLQDFNVSGNQLTGEIPFSLSSFPTTSFRHNPALCGPPLSSKCSIIPTRPIFSIPEEAMPPPRNIHRGRNRINSLEIIAIILGDVLVLGLVSLILYCYFYSNTSRSLLKQGKRSSGEKRVCSPSPYPYPNPSIHAQQERGKMVFFDGEIRRFELEDLLRASAEMLGKGGLGTAYKAVLDDGSVVAVKRLKDLNVSGKKEFEQQMEVLGRLRHPNLLGLKAYYFARDEKLLVCDYMHNGNLFWLLHGNRGPGRTPLDWTTRLKIASGAAQGLAFIHISCKSNKLVHGNIKSTNILIDKGGNAIVSDFGLTVFQSPLFVAKSNGYRAPEAASDSRKLNQKSDVYSFGVLLLELLTGKCPSVVENNSPELGYSGVVDLPKWVQSVVREKWTAEVFDWELMRYKNIEEEMVGLLQIAMACAQVGPDQRPNMNNVVKMMEELRGVEAEYRSVSDSPMLVSEETCS